MMHLMRQVGGRLACQQERSRVRGRLIPVLHREAQTVDVRLDGWRYQQLCRNLDHDTIAGRCWMCSPRSGDATTDQQRTRLPM
jgi:hypothetical protein